MAWQQCKINTFTFVYCLHVKSARNNWLHIRNLLLVCSDIWYSCSNSKNLCPQQLVKYIHMHLLQATNLKCNSWIMMTHKLDTDVYYLKHKIFHSQHLIIMHKGPFNAGVWTVIQDNWVIKGSWVYTHRDNDKPLNR